MTTYEQGFKDGLMAAIKTARLTADEMPKDLAGTVGIALHSFADVLEDQISVSRP